MTINTGELRSSLAQVSRDNDNAVTADITGFSSLPEHHHGYRFVKSDELPLIIIDGVNRAPAAPQKSQVLPNFPNPFNPETWIPYQLAKASNVSFTIYNIRGNVVREVLLGLKASGYYLNKGRAAYWDGTNNVGEHVATGVYFYQFKTDDMSIY